MLEMKITVAAPDLAAAINNLAAALDGKNPHTVCNNMVQTASTLTMWAPSIWV